MQYFWAVLLCCSGIRDVSLTELTASKKGLLSKGLESRITHGYRAELKELPWQVAIRAKRSTEHFGRCGGSLIDKQWVLTAAHCLKHAPRYVDILLGSKKFNLIVDSNKRGFRTSEFYIHPEYDEFAKLNDIALIKLRNPVTFDDTIEVITLANEELPQFSRVIASGWGKTHKGYPSNDLLYAYMITLPNEICKMHTEVKTYRKLCAVSEEVPRRSTCGGDSGGPLAYYNETSETYFLVGVTAHSSIGELNCTRNLPAYFTKVYKFRSWIEDTTGLDFD